MMKTLLKTIEKAAKKRIETTTVRTIEKTTVKRILDQRAFKKITGKAVLKTIAKSGTKSGRCHCLGESSPKEGIQFYHFIVRKSRESGGFLLDRYFLQAPGEYWQAPGVMEDPRAILISNS
jgi:hypothetical protein